MPAGQVVVGVDGGAGSSFPDLMDLAMPAATWQAGLGSAAQLAIALVGASRSPSYGAHRWSVPWWPADMDLNFGPF